MLTPVIGYEGRYSVTRQGMIYSHISNLTLHSIQKPNGYRRVVLSNKNGHRKDHLVHRLVCEAFHGQSKNGRFCVNHINCNKDDNRPENLEWCDHTENMKHASMNGLLLSQSIHMRELNRNRRKAINGCDRDGNVIVSFESIQSARKAGFTAVAYCLLQGGNKPSGGLYWKRQEKIK